MAQGNGAFDVGSAALKDTGKDDLDAMIATIAKRKMQHIYVANWLALKDFVNAGGTLLTLGESLEFAIDRLRVPARDELKGVASAAFYAPGTILGLTIDAAHPLAFGMGPDAGAYFTEGQAFRLLPYTRETRIVASYADDGVLRSGWLVGEEKIRGKAAMAEIPVGKGRVVMYGFRVQHRAQSHGTFKMFLNALLKRG